MKLMMKHISGFTLNESISDAASERTGLTVPLVYHHTFNCSLSVKNINIQKSSL